MKKGKTMNEENKSIVHFADFRCSDAENLQQKFKRLLKTAEIGRSTRLNSSHPTTSRMPSSA